MPNNRKTLFVNAERAALKAEPLVPAFFVLLQVAPLHFFLLPLWLLRGGAFFKRKLSGYLARRLDSESFQNCAGLLDYARKFRDGGGSAVYLLSETSPEMAEATRAALGRDEFDPAPKEPNPGKTLRARISALCPSGEFIYAGGPESAGTVKPFGNRAVGIDAETLETPRAGNDPGAPHSSPPSPSGRVKDFCETHGIRHWPGNLLLAAPVFWLESPIEGGTAANFALALTAFCLADSFSGIFRHLAQRFATPGGMLPPKGNRNPGKLLGLGLVLLAASAIAAAALPVLFIKTFALYALIRVLLTTSFHKSTLTHSLSLAFLAVAPIYAGEAVFGLEIPTWIWVFTVFFAVQLACLKLAFRTPVRTRANEGESVLPFTLGTVSAIFGGLALVMQALFVGGESAPAASLAAFAPVFAPFALWQARLWFAAAKRERFPGKGPLTFAATDPISLIAAAVGFALFFFRI